jgi:hypothetical protein
MAGTTASQPIARFARAAAGRAWRLGLCASLGVSILSCGGGGGNSLTPGGSSGGTPPPAASNVAGIVVDSGPASLTNASPPQDAVNTLFTTVKVCVPGSTTDCQTIDHIQVDTMSYGLRILAPVLTVSLPLQTLPNGDALVECTPFADGYSWGPIALADVQISGETAASVPVQVIGDSNFSTVPANCSSVGPAEDTVAQFGANGILGIGVFAQDCGTNCVSITDNQIYYDCTSTACQPTAVPSLQSETANPITFFAADNNGVIIQLPSVPAQGASTVTGSMIFGIDTQSNNKSGSQTILTVATSGMNAGGFTTAFNGQSFSESFMDTGSNGTFFDDSSITPCTASGLTDFYCPASTESFDATLRGENGISVNAGFSVGDAQSLSGRDAALPLLAGTFPGSTDTFDWGLPFYYGRTVYTAIENAATAAGTGPYVAF